MPTASGADVAGAETPVTEVAVTVTGAEAGRTLAFTGLDAEGLAKTAGASGALGALLLALGSKGRRRNARPDQA